MEVNNMSEVGGINETNFKEIETEQAIRSAVRDTERTVKLLMRICRELEALKTKDKELEEELSYVRQLTGAI